MIGKKIPTASCMKYLNSLNPEQKRAALHHQGPLLILAGAGSGKTKTITHRIIHLIEHHQVSPSRICGVTFTNKAANEMKSRVKSLLSPKIKQQPELSTFHSLCIRILRHCIEALGYQKNFTIYDTSDQISLIRQAMEHYKGGKNFDRKIVLSIISKLKNKNISAEEFGSSSFFDSHNEYHHVVHSIYPVYQKKLKLLNALDYDDLLFLSVRALNQHPSHRDQIAKKFDYLLVDEYQDTNPMQFELLKLLTTHHNNICVVGDDDQSIYAFRGADISIILNFEKHFKNSTIINLEQNYRSNSNILDFANAIIAQNINRRKKKLWSSIKADHLPLLWSCLDVGHEAQVIADDIIALRSKGTSWSHMAILCRSNNQFLPIEEAFKEQQIPYVIYGGQKFYEKKEIKDLLAYLSLIANQNDDLSFRRIVNVPNRGIGDQTLEYLVDESTKNHQTLTSSGNKPHTQLRASTQVAITNFMKTIQDCRISLNTKKPSEVLTELVSEIKYLDYVMQSYPQKNIAEIKKNDVTYFIESVRRFESRHSYATYKECLYEFLQFSMLKDSQDQGQGDHEQITEHVSLLTMHGSKGLEFDHVYLPGIEEDLLPHKKSVDEGADLSEERRLFYVAITRAKERLVMCYTQEKKMYHKSQPRLKSRFLQGLDAYFTAQDRTTLGHLSDEEATAYKKDFFQGLSKLLD